MINKEAYLSISGKLAEKKITLVAVSKTKPVEDILALYNLGQRDFGENYVQELAEKAQQLPADIHWHFIGHLQSNKVKLIIPLVQLIQGVDSLKLLKEIDKEAGKAGKIINCLLQVHISGEETKFGLDETELDEIMTSPSKFKHVHIQGLMGMASFTDDMNLVRTEFKYLKILFDNHAKHPTSNPEKSGQAIQFQTISTGMSADYQIAIEEGSNMVRIGSLIFGERK